MVDKERDLSADEQPQAAEPEADEIVEPQSKYELIMMAAAEATRLNDEIRSKSDEELRRRGINVEGKLTLEALRRVREGKVKAVIRKGTLKPMPPGPPAAPRPVREGLFFAPPKPEEDEDPVDTSSDAGEASPDTEE